MIVDFNLVWGCKVGIVKVLTMINFKLCRASVVGNPICSIVISSTNFINLSNSTSNIYLIVCLSSILKSFYDLKSLCNCVRISFTTWSIVVNNSDSLCASSLSIVTVASIGSSKGHRACSFDSNNTIGINSSFICIAAWPCDGSTLNRRAIICYCSCERTSIDIGSSIKVKGKVATYCDGGRSKILGNCNLC